MTDEYEIDDAELLYEVYDGDDDQRFVSVARDRNDSTLVAFIHPPGGEGVTYTIQAELPPPPMHVMGILVRSAREEAGGWTKGAVNSIVQGAQRKLPGCTIGVFNGEVPRPDG